ncbi:YfbU family protein [Plesiomonas shigelloides]|uniref:YfbU family protein n=1 Tax=Plesiomonas shigelloides TaxID=703 RepID=UPI0012626364|nr:YfbU family protein [Plesiomonas shigelloides]KAB7661743.1 hypothetical protein GBN25_14335 [Plesiomonas shigelloides]
MKFSQADKLQIMMLCEIYRHLGIKDSFNPDLIEEIILSDNYWALEWEYLLASGERIPDDVQLVTDIIKMYDSLKFCYESMSSNEKNDVLYAIPDFSPRHYLEFHGFHPESEKRFFNITQMLKEMQCCNHMTMTLSSAQPMLDEYKALLHTYKLERENNDNTVTKKSLIKVLTAKHRSRQETA